MKHDEVTEFTRALFQTDGFDDITEAATSGAYIGGMAAAHQDAGIAANYMHAADLLVDQALKDDLAYDVVLPVLFLYRHALELRLKAVVRPQKPDHDLAGLVRKLDQMLQDRLGRRLPDTLVERVIDIANHDARADAFRFHTGKSRKGAPGQPHFPEEIWVDLAYLRDVATWIDARLREVQATLRDAGSGEVSEDV